MMRFVQVIALILVLFGCAQKSTISGGPRDTTPPKVRESLPANESVNFKGNKITLSFDEYVSVDGLATQAIVSPPLKYPLESKIKGKTVEISWTDTLLDSTTYSFFLGEAIRDVNERNPLDSNLFVFSTGNELDSLSISGRVTDAKTNKPVSGMLVFLHKELNDSVLKTMMPSYFAKTDESGRFELKYLSKGEYKLSALKDENANYLFDQPSEELAFYDGSVKAGDSILYEMKSFVEKDTTQKLLSKKVLQKERVQLVFNNSIHDFSYRLLELEGNKPSWFEQWSEHKDTLYLWLFGLPDMDSLTFITNLQEEIDTTTLKFSNKKSIAEEKGLFKGSLAGLVAPNKDLKLSFRYPYMSIDTSRLRLMSDSVNIPIQEIEFNSSFVFTLKNQYKKGKRYELQFLPGAITSMMDSTNQDTIRFNFKLNSTADYGNLIFDFNSFNKQDYVLLLKKGDKIIERTLFNDSTEQWKCAFLPKGSYQIELVEDLNGDGEWTPGDYTKKRQPESIYLFQETIDIRPNWDVELQWNFQSEMKVYED